MKTNVIFRGFEGFEHLKKFVVDTIEHSIGRLDLSNVREIKVIVGTTHSRRQGHPPDFSCEAVMKTNRRTFFAKKMDVNFHSAVRKCSKALSKIFINTKRNMRDKKRSVDHHQAAFFFNQSDITATS